MRISAGNLSALLDADLYNNGWDGCTTSYPGQSNRQYAMMSQRRVLLSKYLEGTSDKNPKAETAAFDLFMKVNESCRDWRLDTSVMDDLDRTILGELKDRLHSFFYPVCPADNSDRDFILSLSRVYSRLENGPGKSADCKETDFFSKLASSSLSATNSALLQLYEQAIATNPTWSGMEFTRRKLRGHKVVRGSRLSFAAKKTEIARTICSEPPLNMLFQKGIGISIEEELVRSFGIDLEIQEDKNAVLAHVGSLDGRFGTIDLSSASDSISIHLCREILPRRVFSLLELTRSPETLSPKGQWIELHMISSMGNAFTFPLQTLIFASLVCAVYRCLGIRIEYPRGQSLGNFAVYGDDIIVEQRAYKHVVRMLESLGFRVNAEKSFNEGLFRESCGHDYYRGYNVRGVYIKRLRDANDCYSAINRLVRWSTVHNVELRNLVSYLVKRVRFLPIPYDEGDDMGIKIPLSMLSHPQTHPDTGGTLYRYSKLLERRVPWETRKKVNHKTTIERVEPRLADWLCNPDGEMLALLAGSLRNGAVVLRTTRRRAVIRKRYSSRWDYIPFARGESCEYAVGWRSTAYNLLGKGRK